MSSITILQHLVPRTGVKQALYQKDCNNCAGKKAMAELDSNPVCRSCFAKTLGKKISQIERVYRALKVHA